MSGQYFSQADQPIRNLIPNPSFETTNSTYGPANGATVTRSASSGINSAYGLRVSCPANGIIDSGIGVASDIAVIQGQTYTYTAYLRAVTAGSYSCYAAGNSGTTYTRYTLSNMAAGEVRRFAFSEVASATGPGLWYILRGDGTKVMDFDIDNIMVTEGAKIYPYADGNTPGWQWTGVSGNSPSVGYPYNLESIAGTPAITLNGAGSANFPSITASSGRTVYCVHDAVTGSTGDILIARIGSASSSISRARLLYVGTDYFGQFFNTSNAQTETPRITKSIGRHVGVISLSDGMSNVTTTLDGVSQSAVVTNPTTMTVPTVWSYVTPNDCSAVFTIAYPTFHDPQTRSRITAWLARQYGAPIPTGY